MEKNLDLERIHPSVLEPERRDAPVLSMESVDSFLYLNAAEGPSKRLIPIGVVWGICTLSCPTTTITF